MAQKIEKLNLEAQGPRRKEAIETLGHFMRNPGWFSILLCGARGTGKSHWIRKIHESQKHNGGPEEFQKELVVKRADQIPPERTAMKDIFKQAQMGILVIEDIDELPEYPQQRILLEALVTFDGKLGLDDEREYLRVVFTTSRPITELKSGQNRLLPELWDRISQLVVELPSFADEIENIEADFRETWRKMEFEGLAALPDLRELKEWLHAEGRQFHGNFRDLDKICILWHQYRLIVYGEQTRINSTMEVRVFKRMRDDFDRFSKFPVQQADEGMVFQFEEGQTKATLERKFRAKFKAWALKTYGTMQKAAKELDMSPRTMDRW